MKKFRVCVWCGNDKAEFGGGCAICGRTRAQAIADMAAYNASLPSAPAFVDASTETLPDGSGAIRLSNPIRVY